MTTIYLRTVSIVVLTLLIVMPFFSLLTQSAISANCGDYPFDPNVLSCCDGFLLCERDQRACCGKFCHVESTTVCCGGTVLDKCSVFNSSCCGKKCFDTTKQICCDNKLINRDDCHGFESGCCGGKCFNARKNLCCNDKPVDKCAPLSVAACCGDRCFNNGTESCCNGNVLPKCESGQCCGSKCCPPEVFTDEEDEDNSE